LKECALTAKRDGDKVDFLFNKFRVGPGGNVMAAAIGNFRQKVAAF
jgi:hypothetical protein